MRRALHGFGALLGSALALPAAGEPSFVPLDFLPAAVSDDGRVVVGTRSTGSGWEAVRYENGVTQGGFQPPSGPPPQAWLDTSADGAVLLGQDWLLEGDTWTRLESAPGEPFLGVALSADGTVVIGTDGEVPIRFENGVATPFDPLVDPDVTPRPMATSADASVVVGLLDDGDPWDPFPGAWRHENGEYGGLGPSAVGILHFALALSPGGSTAGGEGSLRPFLWQGVTEIELPRRFDIAAWVSGVVDGGAFAVGTECLQIPECVDGQGIPDPGPVYEAVVWVGGEIASVAEHLTAAGLDVSSWHFDFVDDVTPDGRTLIGTGQGGYTGWLARDVPVPEPGAALLLVVGTALLGSARRLRGPR